MMDTTLVHTMPEHWTELNAARKQTRLCAEEIEALKRSCEVNCGKKHVAECADCYGKVIDRIRCRYRDTDEREWFSQRTAFLNELDSLFNDAKERKKSLKAIEARIEAEKEAWYRWVLRKYPEFLTVSDAKSGDLKSMLDDPDRPREELLRTLWEYVGGPVDGPAAVEKFAEAVEATNGDAAELKKLYVEEFFMNRSTNESLEHSQNYLDEYQASDTMGLEDIIDKIAREIRETRISQPQRDVHTGRLADLHRAKTANEMATAKAAALQMMYDLPPCNVCGGAVAPKDILSCSLCQAITQMGGRKKLTVYCSEGCYRNGHNNHTDREHDCEGGDKCVQLLDEDVEMEDGSNTAVVCKECLDQKQATLYCSERCAAANIAGHRQSKHGVEETEKEEDVSGLVRSLVEMVESTLDSKNNGLKMSRME